MCLWESVFVCVEETTVTFAFSVWTPVKPPPTMSSTSSTTERLDTGPDKIITPLPPRLEPDAARPLRNMDRTCATVKGQVNAINYFLTVMAMQESLTYPHSLSPCNVMAPQWFFCVGFCCSCPPPPTPPLTFRKGQKISSLEKDFSFLFFFKSYFMDFMDRSLRGCLFLIKDIDAFL